MIVLLGAGASDPAGIPIAAKLTEKFIEESVNGSTPVVHHVLRSVVGGLSAAAWRRGHDQINLTLNVEDVFNAMDMLSRRDTVEAAPFIASWDRSVDEIDSMILDKKSLVLLQEAMDTFLHESDSEMEHAKVQSFASAIKIASQGKGAAFISTMEWMLCKLIDYTYIPSTDLLGPYRKFVTAAFNRRFDIVTLNYDNTIEKACVLEGIPCSVGVGDWPTSGCILFPAGSLPLLKLHGSILWPKATVLSDITHKYVAASSWANLDPDVATRFIGSQYGNPTLLFGHRNKLTAEGPFLDLFAEFKARLWQSSDLHVIGYSFRDAHINQILIRWLQTNLERTITIYDIIEEQDMAHRLPVELSKQGQHKYIIQDARETLLSFG